MNDLALQALDAAAVPVTPHLHEDGRDDQTLLNQFLGRGVHASRTAADVDMTSVFRRQTNMADLPYKVRQFIEDKQLIPESSEISAAVSGGADSLALLLILHQLQQPLSFQLSCIHIHHGLRGAEADEDQQCVAA